MISDVHYPAEHYLVIIMFVSCLHLICKSLQSYYCNFSFLTGINKSPADLITVFPLMFKSVS